MASKLRLCGIEPESVVDGPGMRYVVFTQGCPHRCPGCHNPQSHPFDGGFEATIEELLKEISQNPMLKGVTFSGGEPFCQAGLLAELAERVHGLGLDVVTYTGYRYEDLLKNGDESVKLLDQTDLLIDGPFIQEERDLTLAFRGSRNQRLIDLRTNDHP